MPERIASTFASRFRRQHLDLEEPAVERPGFLRRLWSLLLVAAAFALFGAVVWLAYRDVGLGPPIGEPPLIRAAPDPVKVRPEEAEDTTLAEQGTVGRLWSDVEPADQPERLLPAPETPMPPPVVEQPATAEATVPPPTGEPGAAAEAPETAAATGAAQSFEGGAGEAAGDGSGSVAALPAPPPAVTQTTPPAPDPSVREAEAALDRLLAEVTATSGAAGGGAGSAAPTDPASPARPLDQEQGAARTAPAEDAAPAPPPEVRQAGAPTEPPAGAAAPAEQSTETAALSATEPPAPRIAIAPGGDFRIQLAAVRGEADARRAWQLFQNDLGPMLAGVEPIFERAETANGVFYRVQIGPFASEDVAENLCERLKQRDASCFVVRR